jgi:protein-S-isoprenylcysteine O-methyltransferase Ste14
MTSDFIDRGGLWVIAQSLLMAAVVGLAVVFRGQWHSPALFLLGLALFAVGAVLGISGARALGRNRTPYVKPIPDAKLVLTGPYRWVRHPLYASVICASTGWALLFQSAISLIAALPLAILLRAKASREEQFLRQRFPEYNAYAARTPQLFPYRLPRWPNS